MDILTLCRRRVSCRAYKPEPVPREHLEQLVEAARLAPSACNRQPWRFAVVCDQDRRQALARKGLLPGLPSAWIAEAPVIVVIGMERSIITHRVAPRISRVDYPWMDIGIAGEHLVLQATELGLGTCWIGWIRPKAIRRIVDWPHAIRPAVMITVGWPEEGCADAGRSRLPQSDIVRWLEE